MDTIVLYPSPGRGHLVSMVELGKLILKHHPSFSVTVIITTTAGDTGYATTPYINSVTATTPSITFHHLPTLSSPLAHASAANLPNLSFEIPRLNNPNLHQALLAISQSSNLKAFVIDFFCNAAFEVSTKLKIPTYYFFTSGAHGLAIFLYFPTIHRNITKSLKDLDRKFEIHIPGSPPIPVSDMPMAMFDRSSTTYQNFIETANTMPKSAGIMINTFEMLESKSIKAILEGHYEVKASVMNALKESTIYSSTPRGEGTSVPIFSPKKGIKPRVILFLFMLRPMSHVTCFCPGI
ncbi:hypothetical protein L1049_020485 [Liquidambar formosana]|uniref:Uncharacterized protein n=1 Tax=Liquidambar formosana TaxID=63359 RepID=A0AAP0S8S9_LIQFO